MRYMWVFGTICLAIVNPAWSQNEQKPDILSQKAVVQAVDSLSESPVLADTSIVIPKLDFSSVPLFDALTALVRTHNLSVAIDSSVTGNLSLHLVNVRLNDALLYILKEHQLAWERTGSITKLYRPRPIPPPLPPLNISFADDLLTIDVVNADIERFVRTIEEKTGLNIIVQAGTRGGVTGRLSQVEPAKAMGALLSANGFALQRVDGIFYVSQAVTEPAPRTGRISSASVTCDTGLVSVAVVNAPLSDVVNSLAGKCQSSLVQLSPLEGSVTASFEHLSLEQALITLLWNTKYTFRDNNGVILIGSNESEDLYITKLAKLNHLIASTLETLIPATLTKTVSVKVVKEHNGLLLTGPRTGIAKLESFLSEVDVPTAQVLFEVLVVDYTTTDRAEFQITANNYTKDDNKKTYYPSLDLAAQGKDFNDDLNSLSRHLGISNLGKLPDDFYIRLHWMQQQGKAHIRSHPKIAALNGHSASISIGTTQYYLLETSTIYPSQSTDISTQTSQRFEKVEADMKLEVVPFVNNSGELIVEVKPEFNTPAAAFDPDIPPTINRRVLNSTVRLRNGETIVLGGLVQTTKNESIDKFPILGSIPILGRLFQNRTSTDITSELIIYLTPHVYYGSEGAVDLEKVMK